MLNPRLNRKFDVVKPEAELKRFQRDGGGSRMKGNERFRLFRGFLSLPSDSLSTDLDTPDAAAGSVLLFLTAVAAAAADV